MTESHEDDGVEETLDAALEEEAKTDNNDELLGSIADELSNLLGTNTADDSTNDLIDMGEEN